MQVGISRKRLEQCLAILNDRISQGIVFFRDYTLFLTEAWKEGKTDISFCSYYPDLLEIYFKKKAEIESLLKWDSVYLSEEKAENLLNIYDIANPAQIDDGLLEWMQDYAEKNKPVSAGEPTWEPGGGADVEKPEKAE